MNTFLLLLVVYVFIAMIIGSIMFGISNCGTKHTGLDWPIELVKHKALALLWGWWVITAVFQILRG